jgi:hypothetical protein
MKRMLRVLLAVPLCCLSFPAFAQDPPAAGQPGPLAMFAEQHSDELCGNFASLPVDACREIIGITAESVSGGEFDFDELKARLKDKLLEPEILNSALTKAFSGRVPFGIKLKGFESDDDSADASLGVAYDANYNFLSRSYGGRGNWNKRVAVDFSATGNVAFKQSVNPNDFLDTKLTVDGSWSTAMPVQSEEYQRQLTNFALAWAQCDEDEPETQECRDARDAGYRMLDEATAYLNGFQYYEFGLDAGVESDQSFNAVQTKFSAFAFGQYEDWGTNSIIGALGLTPAARIAIDRVDPNKDTPRALAGDSSSFFRFSGEVSLWLPINVSSELPLVFTANYRYYRELGASDVISRAGLEDSALLTLSISGTNGIFVSYSSGELPLDAESDNVVELGWQYYFK